MFAALEQTLQEQEGASGGMPHISMKPRDRRRQARAASVAGYETQTTSSSKLSTDAQAVLFNAAYSAPAAALERAAAAAASPRQRPLPWRTLLRGHLQAKERRGAWSSAMRPSRRENWPGPLLRARLVLPRYEPVSHLIHVRISLLVANTQGVSLDSYSERLTQTHTQRHTHTALTHPLLSMRRALVRLSQLVWVMACQWAAKR